MNSAPDADAPDPASALAQLVDVVVGKYAPLPAASLSHLIHRLGGGVPQWQAQLRATVAETKARLSKAHIDGVDWYWPVSENPLSKRHQPDDAVRLLAPFDPVVWDRRRFEMLWGWPYRFEAYTPAHARERGYYALPLLWRDAVIGWANVSVVDQRLQVEVGFVGTRPRGAVFRAALDQELARMQEFLRLPSTSEPTLCFA